MTDPAALIVDLVRAGLDPALVGRVVDALLSAVSADMSALSADTNDDAMERRRKRDREYRREKRAKSKLLAKANDAAEGSMVSADVHFMSDDMSSDKGDNRCNLLTSFLSSTEEVRKVRGRESVRARGTRMVANAAILDGDRQFARDHGHDDDRILKIWAEFVDYWIGVPGQRGTKLNWSATWRNRIRALDDLKGRTNGPSRNGTGKRTVHEAADELLARVRALNEPAPGDLRNGAGKDPIRRLSSG